MREQSSVITVCKIIIFLLVLSTVHSNSREWYDQLHRSYFNYGSLDDPSSMLRDNQTQTALRLAWGWPFKQQNVIKVMKKPPNSSKENENDMVPNDKFIFPDMDVIKDYGHKSQKPKFGKAPSCEGKTFCEEVSDYPTSFLDNVIKTRNLGTYESVDSLDMSYRIDAAATESLCLSTEQIVYPKTAETVNKQWMYIVNHPNYTQGVRVETCMNEGDKCSIISGFAEGYVTTCEQKYIHRQLAAIDARGSISHELFRFPASCCCQVRFLGTSLRFRAIRSINPQETQNKKDTN